MAQQVCPWDHTIKQFFQDDLGTYNPEITHIMNTITFKHQDNILKKLASINNSRPKNDFPNVHLILGDHKVGLFHARLSLLVSESTLDLCIYISIIYAFMLIYIYIYMYAYRDVCLCLSIIYASIHSCISLCIYVYLCMCLCICIYVIIYIYTDVYVCIRI